jgi:hypothetical protein
MAVMITPNESVEGKMAYLSHEKYVAQDDFRVLSIVTVLIASSVLSVRARSCNPVDRSKPITKQTTPLRQRMIEDMTIRNMSPSTQKIYVAAVANFSIFHGRSPGSPSLPGS